jgi:hypothetical protein
LKGDCTYVILIISTIIVSGLSWIIPTPTYPILGPILIFPFYISIYLIYLFFCKLFKIKIWAPGITKKIRIHKDIINKYKLKKKEKKRKKKKKKKKKYRKNYI